MAEPRFYSLLLDLPAAAALAMAACGIYAVLSYGVGQRTKEIGIRVALGATRARVIGLVMRQGLMVAVIGVGVGVVGALLLTRALADLLFATGPDDPATFAAAVGLLLIVAVAATARPAVRAARMDPRRALETE